MKFNLPMISEMVLPPEGLSANVTGVWPFVGVGPLVDQEVVTFGELAVAILANELFLRSG